MDNLSHKFKNVWSESDKSQTKEIMDYSERYIDFISNAKTERKAAKEIINLAEKKGFTSFDEYIKKGESAPGDKIYYSYRDKSVVLVVLGKEDFEKGVQIVGSHLDAPRLDLKAMPLYEQEEIAYLKTHYYGGVKKYHWTGTPLALHGVIFTEKGEKIDVTFGEDENEPVLFINDLLIHLSRKRLEMKASEVIEAEQLNIIVGSIPLEGADDDKKNPIKENILKILNEKYGITEKDFLRAEFEVVPAGKARSVGFDNSMIAAHGHDDRVCAYATLEAIFNVDSPNKTSIALFVDKEEIGSIGNTSMGSDFFENFLIELISHVNGKELGLLGLRRMWENTNVLSADVTNAFDPNFPEVIEKQRLNTARMGKGIVLAKYGGHGGKFGGNDSNAEFVSYVINIFDKHGIIWQTNEMGKADAGGGGTIAFILANKGAQVIDCGTAMLSMHSPTELLSKADAYMTMKAYEAFFIE